MSLFAKAKKARENKKGFTLVELIVVLVILAILAAIMVPALTGWIDKAKEKQDIIDARSAYLAAQTLASEKYASKTNLVPADLDVDEITTLAEVDGTVTITSISGGKITGMTYQGDGSTKVYTYGANGWDFLAS